MNIYNHFNSKKSTRHETLTFPMSEGVYDTVNVTGEQEYEEPFGHTEFQRPEGVYEMARVAEQTVFDGTLINPESEYMELEDVYKTVRVAEQEVSCQQRCY